MRGQILHKGPSDWEGGHGRESEKDGISNQHGAEVRTDVARYGATWITTVREDVETSRGGRPVEVGSAAPLAREIRYMTLRALSSASVEYFHTMFWA